VVVARVAQVQVAQRELAQVELEFKTQFWAPIIIGVVVAEDPDGILDKLVLVGLAVVVAVDLLVVTNLLELAVEAHLMLEKTAETLTRTTDLAQARVEMVVLTQVVAAEAAVSQSMLVTQMLQSTLVAMVVRVSSLFVTQTHTH
jgi:hypothetical protein